MLKGLAGYLDSVDEVIDGEPLGIDDQIADAYGDLQVLQGAALAVAGSDKPPPLALTKDQVDAVTGALALLDTILTEQNRVDQLRTIESVENRTEFEHTRLALEAANDSWLKRLDQQLSYRQTLGESWLDSLADPEKRRPAALALIDVLEQREDLPQVRIALEKVTAKFKESHDAYLELLFKQDAALTDKERRKRAQIAHDRVIGALKGLTAILTAF